MSQQAVVIPPEPAKLVIGDRQISIDEWPIARTVDERRSVEIERPDDDLLVIAPGRRSGARLVGQAAFIFLCVAVPSVAVAAFELPRWLAVALGIFFLAIFLLLIRGQLSSRRWIRFDQKDRMLTIERKVGFRRAVVVDRVEPLSSILGVQLLYTGRHSVSENQGAGDQQTTSYREFSGYELNLVLDRPDSPRLNLASLADWEWTRRAGQAIGEFLGVSVIDRLYHGE
jgi:hypothetical protein